jgi:hypothetical protein
LGVAIIIGWFAGLGYDFSLLGMNIWIYGDH